MPVLLLAVALFASASLGWQVVEKAAIPPSGWVRIDGQLNRGEEFSFSIAMQQPMLHGLKALLTNSMPHIQLSFEDASRLGAPDTDAVDKVMTWLASYGIANTTDKSDWIYVCTTVERAELLLNTTLSYYAFENQARVLRTTEYHIPDFLKDAVRFIHPIANFMTPKHDVESLTWLDDSAFKKRTAKPPCDKITSPECVREAYNFHYKSPDGNSSVIVGIAGFLDQFANFEDSERFLEEHAPDIARTGYNYTVELVSGGTNSQDISKSGLEAALDIDLALALAFPSKLVYYLTGGRGEFIGQDGNEVPESISTNEPYLELLQYFLNKPDEEIPSVLSISYSDDELSVPRPYAEKVCDMIGVLAARGMTILVASGDGGAMGGRRSSCLSNDGTNRKMTVATFPSTCPWVLAVGAVSNTQTPQHAAHFSSGGFSTYFKRPDWQDTIVKGYIEALEGHLDGYYDSSMRAYPDISAVGTNVLAMAQGRLAIMQGTSASTPIVASILAAGNDARARMGKRSLGWINKLLYSDKVRATLQDITKGESLSCTWDGEKLGGWPAKEGWDAVTGLGVPKDFNDLLQVLVDA